MSYIILAGQHPEADAEGWEHAARPEAERTLCGEPIGSMETLSEHLGDAESVANELSCPYCRSALAGQSDPEQDEAAWRDEVANGDTRLGLQEWLLHKQEADQTV